MIYKTSVRWTKGLNMKNRTSKFVKDNMEEYLGFVLFFKFHGEKGLLKQDKEGQVIKERVEN